MTAGAYLHALAKEGAGAVWRGAVTRAAMGKTLTAATACAFALDRIGDYQLTDFTTGVLYTLDLNLRLMDEIARSARIRVAAVVWPMFVARANKGDIEAAADVANAGRLSTDDVDVVLHEVFVRYRTATRRRK